MARITVVSDAWRPQVNGAVTTLSYTCRELSRLGHCVSLIEPSQFTTFACPTYPEIRLARTGRRDMARRIADTRPDSVLIAIEGPLGLAARSALLHAKQSFTTALLTRFDDYLWERFRFPRYLTSRWLDWFHRPAARILTPTPAMQQMLLNRGLSQARTWLPGVDTTLFQRGHGEASRLVEDLPRPILLYVGRLAVEKNVEAFLALSVPGSKVLIGDGPLLERLRRHHPSASFLGYRDAKSIAEICSVSDVLVFPSRTDTFGHVIVEALSCGLPVAAYPERGPLDILTLPNVGAMHDDLAEAVRLALGCDATACMTLARSRFQWATSVQALLANLVPLDDAAAERLQAVGDGPGAMPAPGRQLTMFPG